jgi:hypothetical protein
MASGSYGTKYAISDAFTVNVSSGCTASITIVFHLRNPS